MLCHFDSLWAQYTRIAYMRTHSFYTDLVNSSDSGTQKLIAPPEWLLSLRQRSYNVTLAHYLRPLLVLYGMFYDLSTCDPCHSIIWFPRCYPLVCVLRAINIKLLTCNNLLNRKVLVENVTCILCETKPEISSTYFLASTIVATFGHYVV